MREAHRSDWFANHAEFRAAVFKAFNHPGRPARPGWEPLDETRQRISAAIAQLVAEMGDELILVGHGTAWTLLISEITGCEPDLSAWTKLRAPDLCTVDLDTRPSATAGATSDTSSRRSAETTSVDQDASWSRASRPVQQPYLLRPGSSRWCGSP
jgi:broad specificity phosphatase PhoE